MRDHFDNDGQSGAMGPNSHVHNNTFNQNINQFGGIYSFKWGKRVLPLFLGFTGIGDTIYGFIRLWQGDHGVVWYLLAVTGALLILGSFAYIGFCKVTLGERPNRKERPFPKIYKLSRILLIVMLLIVLILSSALHKRLLFQHQQVIIVVADFYTDQPAKYQVTEEILGKLKEELGEYNDTRIIELGATITEQKGGSEAARKLGARYDADLVIWGRYAVSDTDVRSIIYVENLSEAEWLSLPPTERYIPQAAVAESNHFVFQQSRSEELSAFALFVSASARHEAQDYSSAIKRLDTALALNKWPDGLISKEISFILHGDLSMHLHDYQQALLDASEAIKINPQSAIAYNSLGLINEHFKNLEQARSDFNCAIDLDPNLKAAYANLAHNEAERGNPQLALDMLNKVIKTDPDNVEAHHARGGVYHQIGDIPKAIDDFTKAIELNSAYAEPQADLGQIYFEQGMYKEAITQFNKAISLSPQFARAYSSRGRANSKLGNKQQAFADCYKAIELDPNFAEGYNHLGLEYYEQDDYENAIENYTKAISLDPQMATYYLNRGRIYRKQEKLDEAIKDYTTSITLSPNNPQAYHLRGSVRIYLGQKQAALEDICKALDLCNDEYLRDDLEDHLRELGVTQCK